MTSLPEKDQQGEVSVSENQKKLSEEWEPYIDKLVASNRTRDERVESIQELFQKCVIEEKLPVDIFFSIFSLAFERLEEKNTLASYVIDTLWLFDTEWIKNFHEGSHDEAEKRLVSIGKGLKEFLPEEWLLSRLDCKFLENINVVPNGDFLNRKIVRTNTSLLYRQKKFNLLREESEGFSHLMINFFDALTCLRNKSLNEDYLVVQVNKSIISTIGAFDLDPNKVLDLILLLFSENLLDSWRFFLSILRNSPWGPNKERKFWNQLPDREKETFLNNLSNANGIFNFDERFTNTKSIMSQVLGHNLQYMYKEDDENLESYFMMVALLIKYNFISIDNIWAHLSPSDEELGKELGKYKDKLDEQTFKAKGNALTMAAPLPDDEIEDGETMDGQKAEAVPEIKTAKPSQKLGLLKSLLSIGDLSSSLLILGRYPFLLRAYPELSNLYHKLLHISISSIYANYSPLKLLPNDVRERLKQPKFIPEDSRLREITLRPPKEKNLVFSLDPFADRFNKTESEVFYYFENYDEDIPILRNLTEFYNIAIPWLRLSGLALCHDPVLVTKLCRIGQKCVDNSSESRTLWLDIIRSLLLPLITLIDVNTGLSYELFELLSKFDSSTRYALYGEWSSTSMKKFPELKLQNSITEKETKGILRRLTKTNVKQFGRLLAKVCHSNPCTVFSIALNQIETYDNLVEVVVDSARFITALDFDALTFIILSSFSNEFKKRLKSDGTSIAHWLQGLASFCGRVFRRYSSLDCTSIVEYVIKQFKVNQMFDLVILKELLSQMTGLQPWTNLSDNQIQGAAGGPVLRQLSLSLIYENPDVVRKSSMRLFNTLQKNGLATQLLVLLSQKYSTCIYDVTDENSHLKLISSLQDECSDVLYLLMEFLNMVCSPKSYYKLIPSFEQLIQDFHIQPQVAFYLSRYKNLDHSLTGSNTEDAMDIDYENTSSPNIASNPVWSIDNSVITELLPKQIWDYFSPNFYLTFWKLSLYDVFVPLERYEFERSRAFDQIRQTDAANTFYSRHRHDRQKIMQLSNSLQNELKEHINSLESVRKVLQGDCVKWFIPNGVFPNGTRLEHARFNCARYLWTLCIAPRLKMSPHDALYCAKFVKLLHSLGTPNFSTMSFLEILFNSQLPSFIFSMTQREADNFGRFLYEVLYDITSWYRDKNLYERECLANGALPGFRLFWSDEQNDPDLSAVLPYNKFVLLFSKWHKYLTSYFESCLLSTEYMHIYNSVIILEKILPCFPLIIESGSALKRAAERLKDEEKREDLKVLALGYFAKLSKKQPEWVSFNSFSGTVRPSSSEKLQRPQQLSVAATSAVDSKTASISEEQAKIDKQKVALNPSAPEFVPDSTPSDAVASETDNKNLVENKAVEKRVEARSSANERKQEERRKKTTPEGNRRALRTRTPTNEDIQRSDSKLREDQSRDRTPQSRSFTNENNDNLRSVSRHTRREPQQAQNLNARREHESQKSDRWRQNGNVNRNPRVSNNNSTNVSRERSSEANHRTSNDNKRDEVTEGKDKSNKRQDISGESNSRQNNAISRAGRSNGSNRGNDSRDADGRRSTHYASNKRPRSSDSQSPSNLREEDDRENSRRSARQDDRRDRDSRQQRDRPRDRTSRSAREEKRRKIQ
ncbi:hypothetical protein POMI540_0224 [Schizosaccharomyces pombe]